MNGTAGSANLRLCIPLGYMAVCKTYADILDEDDSIREESTE